MVMSPGTYLRLRREAAELSIEDVAMMMPTIPDVHLNARADWLRQIEAGGAPIGDVEIKALRFAFRFDHTVLRRLEDLRLGADLPAPRLCRRCACSECDACDPSCWWIAEDLCSACPIDEPGEDAAPANDEGDTAPDHAQDVAA